MNFYLIAPRDVPKFIGHKKILFVDIREKEEYLEGHIDNAVHVPYEGLERKLDWFQSYRMLILYCGHGNRSLLAARGLNNKGLRVGSIVGGYEAYREAVREKQAYFYR